MKEFDAVLGYDALKKELIQIADSLKFSQAYETLGGKPPRGLLLNGEPGVGKTLMSTCLIQASGRTCYTFRKELCGEKFAEALRKTFREAAENQPSIVFLDDLDKFSETDRRRCNAEEYVEVQACIDSVREMDVFVLATANELSCLPESLLRPGRFDRQLKVPLPSEEDAEAIIRHYLADKTVAENLDREVIVRVLTGWPCAQLETTLNEAALIAGYARCDKITMDHFNEACLRTLFDVPAAAILEGRGTVDLEDWEDELARAAWHEAGHVAVQEVLRPESVTFASIFPSSCFGEGFVISRKTKNSAEVSHRVKRILCCLGGAAASDMIYGMADSGTSKDFEQAFRLSERLEKALCVTDFSLYGLLGEESPAVYNDLARVVGHAVARYFRMAKEILARNRDFFEAVARALAEKRLLTSVEIREIRSRFPLYLPDLS